MATNGDSTGLQAEPSVSKEQLREINRAITRVMVVADMLSEREGNLAKEHAYLNGLIIDLVGRKIRPDVAIREADQMLHAR